MNRSILFVLLFSVISSISAGQEVNEFANPILAGSNIVVKMKYINVNHSKYIPLFSIKF